MVLGSQNLDTQSFDHSREAGVAIDDPATTTAFDALHGRIWSRSEVAFDGRTAPPPPAPRLHWLTRLTSSLGG
jgi:phosphatidylserine/phosphatidylglycerophosphate/cardiolipin synthase-like enzyme